MRLKNAFLTGLICLFGLFSTQAIFAQKKQEEQDTVVWYYDLSDYFNLSASFIETQYETFVINDEGQRFDIEPNFSFYNKIGIDYRVLSLFLSFKPKIIENQDDDLRGESDIVGFGVSLNTSNLINRLSFRSVKGFYLKNTADFDPDFIEGQTPYIQFPNLEYTAFAGTHYYKFNKNFSYQAYNVQMAQQVKSAGSFATGISWVYYLIDNKVENGDNSTNFEIMYDGAYYYSFIHKEKWYLNLGLIAGIGGDFSRITSRENGMEQTTNFNALKLRVNGLIGAGYNSKSLYTGVDFRFHSKAQDEPSGATYDSEGGLSFKIFLGFHILAPKGINRTYNKIEEWLGIRNLNK